MRLINYIITILGGVIGIVLGPLIYVYRTNPTIIHEMLYFIGKNSRGVIVTGISLSMIYFFTARFLIDSKIIKVKEHSLRNAAISVGIINAVSTMLTLLPSVIL